jgi:hypothetical protein
VSHLGRVKGMPRSNSGDAGVHVRSTTHTRCNPLRPRVPNRHLGASPTSLVHARSGTPAPRRYGRGTVVGSGSMTVTVALESVQISRWRRSGEKHEVPVTQSL